MLVRATRSASISGGREMDGTGPGERYEYNDNDPSTDDLYLQMIASELRMSTDELSMRSKSKAVALAAGNAGPTDAARTEQAQRVQPTVLKGFGGVGAALMPIGNPSNSSTCENEGMQTDSASGGKRPQLLT